MLFRSNPSTSIGPITDFSTINSGIPFSTNVGALVLSSAGDAAFTARGGVAVVPPPATLPMFATGLGALGLLGWRGGGKPSDVIGV